MGQRRLTFFLTRRVQAVSLVQGSVNVRLPVAGAAASVNTRGTLFNSGSRDADSEAGNGGEDLCFNFESMTGYCLMNSNRIATNVPWR